ncbi:MAG: helix-turn-helix transcriptional regulator [Verrucomicrobiota bacterium]|nr:helix-turn-helix transcriptional regulator [Verrucomicrobiota bacterium]
MKKTIYDPRYCELIAWLKQQRKEKQFTMRVLAQKLDCSYSFIGKYERNQIRLDVLQYQEICSILEIDSAEGLELIKNHRS